MTNYKTLSHPTSEEHLTAGQLYQYLDGEMPSDASHRVEQHLLDCPLCADALDGLSLVRRQDAEQALFEINHQIKNRSSRRKNNPVLNHVKNWGLTTAILFLLVFSGIMVWYLARQTAPVPATQTATFIQSAAPVSGYEAYYKYLQLSLQYPAEAEQNRVAGTVMLQFMVNSDGSVSGIKVQQSLGYGCDQEAVRLLREGPPWQPAFQNGKPVSTRKMLKINFRLPSSRP